MPVSAKMRLGVNDDSRAVECALAIESGGATELVVHARTKADAYRPPAYWARIADIRVAVRIPVVANGEIWNVQDALRCRELSGCEKLMLGRGMVTDPGLALAIQAATVKSGQNGERFVRDASASPLRMCGPANSGLSWQTLLPHIADFWQLVCARLERRQQAGRLKQWLNFLRRCYPEAESAYMALRAISEPAVIDQWLAAQGFGRDTFADLSGNSDRH
jgi:tRNA-dihydrouridine synthase C